MLAFNIHQGMKHQNDSNPYDVFHRSFFRPTRNSGSKILGERLGPIRLSSPASFTGWFHATTYVLVMDHTRTIWTPILLDASVKIILTEP